MDAMLSEVLPSVKIPFRGVQKRLRRNAPDIEASAPETGIAFHKGYGHAELRRPNSRYIAPWTTPDDDDVIPLHEAKVHTSREATKGFLGRLVIGFVPKRRL